LRVKKGLGKTDETTEETSRIDDRRRSSYVFEGSKEGKIRSTLWQAFRVKDVSGISSSETSRDKGRRAENSGGKGKNGPRYKVAEDDRREKKIS